MRDDKRKVVLVGTGMVGMSYAYSLVNQGGCEELVLIDLDRQRAIGEALDLSHGLPFSPAAMNIYAGEYSDCSDADLVVICAGVAQKEGESRTDLLQRNIRVFQSIIDPVVASGFHGIFLVATNPVDVLTKVTHRLSGFPAHRVMGTGTTLDTARLRYTLGEYFHVDPRNMHAYVMGEHGDSEFVPWSQALLATKPVLQLFQEYPEVCRYSDIEKIAENVRTAAYDIIKAKKATYYGIGMALTRITKAIFGNENSILTVSAHLNGEYGQKDVFAGVPAVVNRRGVERVLQLSLTQEELSQMEASCQKLRELY